MVAARSPAPEPRAPQVYQTAVFHAHWPTSSWGRHQVADLHKLKGAQHRRILAVPCPPRFHLSWREGKIPGFVHWGTVGWRALHHWTDAPGIHFWRERRTARLCPLPGSRVKRALVLARVIGQLLPVALGGLQYSSPLPPLSHGLWWAFSWALGILRLHCPSCDSPYFPTECFSVREDSFRHRFLKFPIVPSSTFLSQLSTAPLSCLSSSPLSYIVSSDCFSLCSIPAVLSLHLRLDS